MKFILMADLSNVAYERLFSLFSISQCIKKERKNQLDFGISQKYTFLSKSKIAPRWLLFSM